MSDGWEPEDGAGYIPTEEGEENPDYEREWDDLTERDLLEGIFIELTQIRTILSQADTSDSRATTMYECNRCGASVKPEEREGHAVNQHNAPVDMVESLFSEQ